MTRKILGEPHLVFGKRAEALFPYVAATLGRATLITEEGSGEIWAPGNVTSPDWRVLLPDIGPILVEVKNAHHRHFNFDNAFTISAKALDRVRAYSTLSSLPLFLAIYWTSATRWTLVSTERLHLDKRRALITYAEAQEADEMSLLGDFMVSLESPVRVDFTLLSPTRGTKRFTAGGKELPSTGAALIEAMIMNSRCVIDSQETTIDGRTTTRFTFRTRVYDDHHVMTEPISGVITYRALDLDHPPSPIPPALHSPRVEDPIINLLEAAEADGVAIERFIFSNRG